MVVPCRHDIWPQGGLLVRCGRVRAYTEQPTQTTMITDRGVDFGTKIGARKDQVSETVASYASGGAASRAFVATRRDDRDRIDGDRIAGAK